MSSTSDIWLFFAVIGSAFSVWLYPGWPTWPFTIALVFSLAMVFIRYSAPALAVSGLLCGIWWGIFNVENVLNWELPESDWRSPLTIHLVIDEITNSDPHRIRLDGTIVHGPEHWLLLPSQAPVKARVHWYGYQDDAPRLGETWSLQVRLRPASGLLNEGGFNYQAYLLRRNIRVTGSIISGERLATPIIQSPRQIIFDYFDTYRDYLPFADLMLALSIGERQWMSQQRWQVLQHTGVAHLMAISGLHLTFVFGVAMMVIKVLVFAVAAVPGIGRSGKQSTSTAVVLSGAWLVAFAYAGLAGFAVATVRALMLISLFVLLRLKGNSMPPLRTFLRAVLLVLVVDSMAWLDIGFWLSAGAVLAIFVWQWRLPLNYKASIWGGVRSLWQLEIMLTLMLLPLSLMFFQGMSLIAPVTNLLVVPVFSFFVLPLCLFAALMILTGIPGAGYLLRFNDAILGYVWFGLEYVAGLDLSWIDGYQPVVGWMLLLVVVIAYIPVRWGKRFMLGIALCISVSLTVIFRQEVHFAVHILDVGQGSAIVVQQGRKAFLFDAGPAYPGGFDTGRSTVLPFLRMKGLEPEFMVLSHPHRDHTGGAETLRRAFPNMQVFSDQSGDLRCGWGQQWIWHQVRVKALAPMPGPSFGPNNDSCVLQLTYPAKGIEYEATKIMLTGDIQQLTELRMVGRYQSGFESDILMVPHHGSSTSSQGEFLDQVTPAIAVASRGYLNQFSMPRDDVQQRYRYRDIQVYDTAIDGQVSLFYDGHDWQAKTYRQSIAGWWFNQQQGDAIW